MSKKVLFPLFVLLTTLSAKAQTITAAKDSARVVFYRNGQFMGSGTNFTIRANGTELCRLSNNRYLVYSVAPGTVKFSSVAGGLNIPDKEFLELKLEKGKVYYVQCDVKQSFVAARVEMTEVTESTATKKMVKLKPDNCMVAGK